MTSPSDDRQRIRRFLKMRSGAEEVRVKEAGERIHELIVNAKKGRASIIGSKNPVILINAETLEEMLTTLREPENWGEFFATMHDGSENNEEILLAKGGS